MVETVDPGLLERLLLRIRAQSDFPALSAAVTRIQRLTSSESASVHMLADEILRDVALTQKLLRWVNAAYYSHAGGGSIGTVSRAVALIGFGGVRNLALSLVLLEHMDNRAQALRLRREFLRALLAANVAAELSASVPLGEEAFLGTLFQHLGHLLVEYSMPDEALRIAAGEPAERVLGVSLATLAHAVAEVWSLPESIREVLELPTGEAPRRAVPEGPERVRWMGRAAQEVSQALLNSPPDRSPALLNAVAHRYAAVLGLQVQEIVDAAERVRQGLPQWAQALGLESNGSGSAARPAQAAAATAAATATSPPENRVRDEATDARAIAVLTAGVQDITDLLVQENTKLDDVVRVLLESSYRALAPQRVVACWRRDAKSPLLSGRLGLGLNAASIARAFQLPTVAQSHDLFSVVCAKSADTLLADARSAEIAGKLPPWYRQHVDAPTMLLLPLTFKQQMHGLIYLDQAQAGSLQLGDRVLSLLKTLRNQVLMALRTLER